MQITITISCRNNSRNLKDKFAFLDMKKTVVKLNVFQQTQPINIKIGISTAFRIKIS